MEWRNRNALRGLIRIEVCGPIFPAANQPKACGSINLADENIARVITWVITYIVTACLYKKMR
jgi:hypothetical protein